jgi:hypothetical protein
MGSLHGSQELEHRHVLKAGPRQRKVGHASALAARDVAITSPYARLHPGELSRKKHPGCGHGDAFHNMHDWDWSHPCPGCGHADVSLPVGRSIPITSCSVEPK